MKPLLTFQDDYEVPPCTLPADHPMRGRSVIVQRLPDGWDIRLALPMYLKLPHNVLEGAGRVHRAGQVAKNCGVMMTNDLWLEIVPLIKETLVRDGSNG